MSQERESADPRPFRASRVIWLEQVTAGALLAVLLALAWIILAASDVEWIRLVSVESEVVVMVALLGAALLLVSVLALRNTGDSGERSD